VKIFINGQSNLLPLKNHLENTLLFHQPIYQGHTRKHALIVGLGNIGYRHYQSLFSSGKYHIHILEKSEINRNKIELEDRNSSSYESIQQIPNTNVIDIVIVSTQADIRSEITKQILSKFQVNNILFEKPLCQSINQLDSIIELTQIYNVKSWINTILITHELFKKIKSSNPKNIQMTIYGNWDICSNLPHYITLWCYLTNNFEFRTVNNLYPELFNSKRIGNKEIKGHIQFISTNDNSTLNIYSGKTSTITGNIRENIMINCDKLTCFIDVNKNYYNISSVKNEFIYQEGEFEWPKVSEHTSQICDDIINNGTCDLIKIEKYYILEKELLKLYSQIFSGEVINIS